MRLTSIRTRALILSVVLAASLVAALLSSSFLVVSSRMEQVAATESARLSRSAWQVVRAAVTDSLLSARSEGLKDAALRSAASTEFASSIPEKFGVPGTLLEGMFAFYDLADDEPLKYYSDKNAIVDDDRGRARAVANGQPVTTHVGGHSALSNMLTDADLGLYVVHVPFHYPDGRWWVLDVVYDPVRERETIDRIRSPMLALSLGAIVATALLMQLTLGWVLRLVNDLRAAAESVEAGNLDVHLPDSGSNEIGDLARAINALITRLRARADAQTRFVADASHELATPVAGIRGYVNILRGWGAEDPSVRSEAVAAIDRESRRMARLTTQLLEAIRSEEVIELHSTRHDVNTIVRAVLAQASDRYADKELEFVGPDPGPLVMFGDPDRIEDALSILVDNASKYTPEYGRVSVQTYRRKGDVVIEVSDTGPGIPPDDLENIFHRFYRSDTSRAKQTGGFGLGLAIAKRIVDSAGGLIDVRSEVGSGTTFILRLPRGRD